MSYESLTYSPPTGGVKSLDQHRSDFALIFKAKLMQLQTSMRQGAYQSVGGLRGSEYEVEVINPVTLEDPMERSMSAWEKLNRVYKTLIGDA